jgi:hypothetical protein
MRKPAATLQEIRPEAELPEFRAAKGESVDAAD